MTPTRNESADDLSLFNEVVGDSTGEMFLLDPVDPNLNESPISSVIKSGGPAYSPSNTVSTATVSTAPGAAYATPYGGASKSLFSQSPLDSDMSFHSMLNTPAAGNGGMINLSSNLDDLVDEGDWLMSVPPSARKASAG
eukprot:CAMPEP_0182886472 /NCGR_PEP_ID=MMETSP0034_2-20130328/20237_1 /TAXON_ID=156128 /ORGANISM="Nephroselmis pyriformis, Strain CCMP717" /LENGTH=138 /DNA_ID=CAMNT_0025019797 /DNA_START=113 /DNA_END=526 /DNA_ORIENTATION=+